MSAASALALIKSKFQGTFNSDSTIAASNDEARKAYSQWMRFPTSAAATTATVAETHLSAAPFACKVKKAYFTIDGTTLSATQGAYATVTLARCQTDGSTTTSLATCTNSSTAFTDQLPKAMTLATTIDLAEGATFQYNISKSSATTNQAVPAGSIDIEIERMD